MRFLPPFSGSFVTVVEVVVVLVDDDHPLFPLQPPPDPPPPEVEIVYVKLAVDELLASSQART